MYKQMKKGEGTVIKVVAKNFIKLDKKTEVLEIIKELVEKTREEKGCIKYELFQDVESEGAITFIEEWESREALGEHMASEHFKRIVPQIKDNTEKDGEISIYTKLI
mgnify:FL=1